MAFATDLEAIGTVDDGVLLELTHLEDSSLPPMKLHLFLPAPAF